MSDTIERPRIRVPSGSSPVGGKSFMTGDSFQNFAAQLGYGTQNLSTANTYGINPITRNHTQLEWMYRGSWIVKQIVDAVADDMTRAGTDIEADMHPGDIEELNTHWRESVLWQRINSTIKWSRLYGGAMAVMMIEGQRMDTPLRTDTIMRGQFKGLVTLDRWMVWPSLSETVTDLGPDFGLPKYYQVVSDVRGLPKMKIHYSRVIRMDGVELPYWQSISENSWALSVVEPLIDRLVAFDSVTQGAAQLAFKAHLRVMKVEGLRELIASGGLIYQAFLQQMAIIRLMQTNEGMTVIDAADDFQVNAYSFAGLSDLLIQFGQQLSGACQIPLTRLFGQSPAGMNATGESDMRNYYDAIKSQQEARLRRPLSVLYDVVHRSYFGRPLPKGFSFSFTPLWQLSETEKATIAGQVVTFIDMARQGGLIGAEIALKELRQASKQTGYFSNVDDAAIEAAKQDDLMPDPPAPDPNADPNAPADPNEQQGTQPGQGSEPAPQAPPARPKGGEEETPSDDATAKVAKSPRRKHHVVSKMYPNAKGKTLHDLPSYARPHMMDRKDVAIRYRGHVNGHSKGDVLKLFRTRHTHDGVRRHTVDGYPMRDVHGMTVVIETEKGNSRMGYGWASTVGADYGYITGTGSAEGASEQMDCFVGTDATSTTVYILQQIDPLTQRFDEHKVMLNFGSKADAVAAYEASFSDGSGVKRVGRVSQTTVEALKTWLKSWPYKTTAGRQPEGALP
jgi:phage-related protein (TIGR01555 family)